MPPVLGPEEFLLARGRRWEFEQQACDSLGRPCTPKSTPRSARPSSMTQVSSYVAPWFIPSASHVIAHVNPPPLEWALPVTHPQLATCPRLTISRPNKRWPEPEIWQSRWPPASLQLQSFR